MSFKYNEQACRRDIFSQDVPVALCDGQIWWLAKPRVVFRPTHGPNGYGSRMSSIWGDDYYKLIEDVIKAGQSGDLDVAIASQFALCCELLLRNYDLTQEQLSELIYFDLNEDPDESNVEMRQTLLRTAQGIGPKA